MYKYGDIIEMDNKDYIVGQACKYQNETYLLLVEEKKFSEFIYAKLINENEIEVVEDPDITMELVKLLKTSLKDDIDKLIAEEQ